ncbi:MAG: phage tail sheath subtilisin-like domain-containing protein [Candidatus Gastranaerophilales bacterium]|nr:phage tail sheath subtilisin-like domain-containing protein [Candidatus Gastranaerophilales bacterium]
MAASFLHGVETIEVTKGARSVTTVKTAVIGLVGTAPVEDIDEDYRTVNEPVVISSDTDAVKYFGNSKSGYTIPQALDAIFDQGAGIVIVINVYDPDIHSDVSEVTKADIIGGVDSDTGKRTGLNAFQDCYSLFGYYPKTIIAPVFCEETAVVTEINSICEKIRAIGLVDAPVGTTVQEAITGRGSEGTINFNTSSDRIVLCYPHVKVYDSETDSNILEPYSQRLAGVIAAKDLDKGYHWSPSNTEINGIVGVEKQLTSMINDPASEVNQLNEAGIVTIFNSYGSGLRTWGNRSAAYPASVDPTNFINVRRTADILHESVEYSMLQFMDYPIDNGLIDSICETVNQFIRSLIGRGALIDGKCSFNSEKNSSTDIAAGHLTFDIEFMPPTPAERITFESFIDISLLESLGAES